MFVCLFWYKKKRGLEVFDCIALLDFPALLRSFSRCCLHIPAPFLFFTICLKLVVNEAYCALNGGAWTGACLRSAMEFIDSNNAYDAAVVEPGPSKRGGGLDGMKFWGCSRLTL